jgi:hypothetical protein
LAFFAGNFTCAAAFLLGEANVLSGTSISSIIDIWLKRMESRENDMKTSQSIKGNMKLAWAVGTGALLLGLSFIASPANGQNAPIQAVSGPDNQASASNEVNLPATLTIPAGTVVPVRVSQWISSDKNQPGDRFSATLEQPIVANGWVVARRGQTMIGRVSVAQKASHNGGVSQLGVELNELTLVDGQVLPAKTQMVRGEPQSTPPGRNVGIVGTTTALGAVIGAAADGGEGAAIGAGLGATAGLIGILSTRGNPTIIYPESVLTFRLDVPITVSTEQSQIAFQPVSQEDFGKQASPANASQPRLVRRPPPPPYPYGYYAYPGPYAYGYGYDYYGYPAPYYYSSPLVFGFYGNFGHGGYGRFGHFRR